MKANELKRGMAFQQDAQTVVVKQMTVQTASSRSGNTLYKVLGQDLVSGQKFERSYKGDEQINTVDVSKRSVQLLYRDAEGWTLMDSETYEQFTVSDESISDELPYMSEGLEGVSAMILDEVLLGIELPTTVVLTIEDCAPAMKAASSSARTKPATLNTGLVVQVPEYLTPGENIKVNTDTAEFISRA